MKRVRRTVLMWRSKEAERWPKVYFQRLTRVFVSTRVSCFDLNANNQTSEFIYQNETYFDLDQDGTRKRTARHAVKTPLHTKAA